MNDFDSLFHCEIFSLSLVNQKLFFYLGGDDQTTPANTRSRTNMASISKVTRNSNEPPSHSIISEWFNYTSASISAVGTYRDRERNETFGQSLDLASVLGVRDFPSMDDADTSRPARPRQYDQTTESIFILPALELHFQTRQLEGQCLSSIDHPCLRLRCILGQVHCSFETDFYGHIMFTFNAEHFYFLHDLISSYIKEKDRSKFE
jgi:hypothetical protein